MNEKPAIFLEVTRRCNNKCDYCGAWRYLGTDKELTRLEYKKLFSVIKQMNFQRVNFTGGEPTIRSDIKDLVSDAITIVGGNIHLTINGTIILKKNLWNLPVSLKKSHIKTSRELII